MAHFKPGQFQALAILILNMQVKWFYWQCEGIKLEKLTLYTVSMRGKLSSVVINKWLMHFVKLYIDFESCFVDTCSEDGRHRIVSVHALFM